jgi:hypothetical protein
MIDDPDDACVGGHFDRMKREAGFFTADEKYRFTHAGANGIDGNQGSTRCVSIGVQWLEQQQLDTVQVLVLDGRYDVADDLGDLHSSYDPWATST